MKQFFLICYLLITVISSQCFSQAKSKKPISGAPEVLTDATIIDLHKAGLDDDLIISKVQTTNGSFDLSTAKLIELKQAGISSPVIKALMAKNNDGGTATKEMVKAATKNISVELLNRPYYLDPDQNEYKPTEKASATLKTKSKMFGYGGTNVSYIIDGDKSSLRIQSGNTCEFIISTGNQPPPDMTLYKLTVEKNTRQAITQKINGMSSSPLSGGQSISFDISRVSDGIYKLTPSKSLDKGEYFFATKPVMSANTIDVFAFGID